MDEQLKLALEEKKAGIKKFSQSLELIRRSL